MRGGEVGEPLNPKPSTLNPILFLFSPKPDSLLSEAGSTTFRSCAHGVEGGDDSYSGP